MASTNSLSIRPISQSRLAKIPCAIDCIVFTLSSGPGQCGQRQTILRRSISPNSRRTVVKNVVTQRRARPLRTYQAYLDNPRQDARFDRPLAVLRESKRVSPEPAYTGKVR